MIIVWNAGETLGPAVWDWSYQSVEASEQPDYVAGRATKWVAEPGGRKWTTGRNEMGKMVRNTIKEASPGSGTFRAMLDLGDLKELHVLDEDDDPVVIESCTVAISPSGPTVTSPATVENAYTVSTIISGTATSGNTYSVTFVATLSTGQVLPPRVADWIVA